MRQDRMQPLDSGRQTPGLSAPLSLPRVWLTTATASGTPGRTVMEPVAPYAVGEPAFRDDLPIAPAALRLGVEASQAVERLCATPMITQGGVT